MLLELDFSSAVPIYMQIRNQVIMGIADGRLSAGEKLPTIRALADETGINMMTANKAYQLLKQEGYISTDRRNGAVIITRRSAAGGAAPHADLSEKSKAELKLLISEAKLKGMSREAFLALAASIYETPEV